ncbi:MAG: GNAT family N-acetyltransferase [Prolixibacteraceae bacterium]|jgi:ribosomal protein S18 acetylase RimI-like enzyme
MIEQAIPADALALAELHCQTISEGFLVRLGTSFLKSLYAFLIRHEMVFVYRDGSKIIGFISGSIRPDGMMIKFLILCPFSLVRLALKSLVNPKLFKSILETFKVPEKSKWSQTENAEIKLPDTEMLSMSIDPAFQNQQIGTQLFLTMEKHLGALGVKKYKVIAMESLIGANNFCIKNGFYLVTKIKVHGDTISNVYVKEITSPVFA